MTVTPRLDTLDAARNTFFLKEWYPPFFFAVRVIYAFNLR